MFPPADFPPDLWQNDLQRESGTPSLDKCGFSPDVEDATSFP